MTVRPSVRFEVFKRDRFTCAYCGRTPPDALLHVDHVVPRVAGGTDDMENLLTACQDCNLGKGARLLEEGRPIPRGGVEDLEERLAQARAYIQLITEVANVQDHQAGLVIDRWAQVFRAESFVDDAGRSRWRLPSGQEWPDPASIRRLLRRITVEQMFEAIDITASRFGGSWDNTVRYFFGVCYRMARGEER